MDNPNTAAATRATRPLTAEVPAALEDEAAGALDEVELPPEDEEAPEEEEPEEELDPPVEDAEGGTVVLAAASEPVAGAALMETPTPPVAAREGDWVGRAARALAAD